MIKSRKYRVKGNLKESRVFRLFVVFLGRVFPRDPEHGFLLILPAQAFIPAALYLRNEPLFQVHLRPFFHLQHILSLKKPAAYKVYTATRKVFQSRSLNEPFQQWFLWTPLSHVYDISVINPG